MSEMSEASWRFRTTKGIVTVRNDAIVLRSTPTQLLAGQQSRWQDADRWERVRMAFESFNAVFSLAGLAYFSHRAIETGLHWRTVALGSSVVFFVFTLWKEFVRDVTIPLDAIDEIVLDAEKQRLTVTHEPTGGLASFLRDDETKTTLTLRTPDDHRIARDIFRLRGIELLDRKSAEARETETTYRFDTKNGACFCERCDSQVSPNDAVCPACEYALRVETIRET